jgi:hypothetical protein
MDSTPPPNKKAKYEHPSPPVTTPPPKFQRSIPRERVSTEELEMDFLVAAVEYLLAIAEAAVALEAQVQPGSPMSVDSQETLVLPGFEAGS